MKTIFVAFKIDSEIHKKLKIYCIQNGLKLQHVVNELIKEKVNKQDKKNVR